MEVVFVRCRRLLKYIIYEILHHKDRKGQKASAVGFFAVFAPFAVNQIMKPSPPPSPCSPVAPFRLHFARVPVLLCSARPCGVGAGRRFSSISCVYLDSFSVSCWQGKCPRSFTAPTILKLKVRDREITFHTHDPLELSQKFEGEPITKYTSLTFQYNMTNKGGC